MILFGPTGRALPKTKMVRRPTPDHSQTRYQIYHHLTINPLTRHRASVAALDIALCMSECQLDVKLFRPDRGFALVRFCEHWLMHKVIDKSSMVRIRKSERAGVVHRPVFVAMNFKSITGLQ